jgi:capsid protein
VSEQDTIAAAMAARDNGIPTSAGRRKYVSSPSWSHAPEQSSRYWESAESNRLNSAHWANADDASLNVWIAEHLTTLRLRSNYEARNNGIMLGMQNTHSDDIWGQDGPTLQVVSDDPEYNARLEEVWADWWSAPTLRNNISGATLGKMWTRNLWRCGEFLSRIVNVDDVDGPIQMRLWPANPRRLATPSTMSNDDNVVMGIRHDSYERPTAYYIDDQAGLGTGASSMTSTEWPYWKVIHEFLIQEEDQVRGVPLQATGLQTSADLRDFDDQIHDAARLMADRSTTLYATGPDVQTWQMPESMEFERRTVKMAPPGWQPHDSPATQPPVQFPDYRAERHGDLGRPVGMPRLLVRLDASKHSWASARLDMTSYKRSISCLQAWFSGSEKSAGILNRLVNEVAKEARYLFPELRNAPKRVRFEWTWPQMDEIDPIKTQGANEKGLQTGCLTLIDVLAGRKKTLKAHVVEQQRVRDAYEEAGLPMPSWMSGAPDPTEGKDADDEESKVPVGADEDEDDGDEESEDGDEK